MIVKMNEQKLWVEGDKAYSVDDIASKYDKLNAKKSELESKISEEAAIIDEHLSIKNAAINELAQVNAELEGVGYIHNKILEAESVESAPIEESEVEGPIPETEEVKVPEEVVVLENSNETIEEVAEPAVVNVVSESKPMIPHRRFRV